MNKEIIEELISSLKIAGNDYLAFLFEKNKDSSSELLLALKRYNGGIFVEGLSEEVEEAITKIHFINLEGIVIDFKNIDRIEKIKEYNSKRQNFDYKLRIFKKFVTPLTEFFDIKYETEEEREKSYSLLKAKLSYLNKKIF